MIRLGATAKERVQVDATGGIIWVSVRVGIRVRVSVGVRVRVSVGARVRVRFSSSKRGAIR